MVLPYSLEILSDNPEVYWRLGEDSGTVAEDTSGHIHTGQYAAGFTLGQAGIIGADPEPDPNTAVFFDGVTAYFTATVSTWGPYQSATRSLTIEFWYQGTDVGNTDDEDSNAVLFRAWGGFAGRWLITLDTSGFVRLFTGSPIGSTTPCGVSTTAVNDDVYHHVVITIAASTYDTEVWIDGNLEDTGTGVEGAGSSPIVGMASQLGAFTEGALDEIAIYFSILSSTRIGDHWTSGSSPPPPPVEGAAVGSIAFAGVAVGTPVEAGTGVGEIAFDGVGVGSVEPFPVPFVNLAGAVRAAIVNPPLIILPEDAENPLRARILRLPNLDVIATVQSGLGDEAREQRNAPGSGSLTLLNDDPIAALVQKYDLIQQIIEGQVAFTQLVENITTIDVATEEEPGERTTYTGRGHIALLEMGLVYPSRGPGSLPIERDRVFNWTSQVYDASTWAVSTDVGPATGPTRVPLLQAGPPSVAPSVPGNTWRGSTGDTQSFAPGGPVYYRSPPISVPATQEYVVMWGADNYGELYAGGQQIDALPKSAGRANYLEGHAIPIVIDSGSPIVFAARVFNVGAPVPVVNPNPVGLFFLLVTLDEDGFVDDVITFADSSWVALGRPATEPGMTPAEVARITLEEWQARAVAAGQDIPGIVLTCTDETDTLGQPWIETPNIATKVGTDILVFFTEIAATYWEMRMRPATLQLDLLIKGTEPPSGVTYVTAPPDDPNEGNMRSLIRRTG